MFDIQDRVVARYNASSGVRLSVDPEGKSVLKGTFNLPREGFIM
ncbi:MAG: hypothetical protein ACLFQB_07975 [Chitinispirillaceae bacterium]